MARFRVIVPYEGNEIGRVFYDVEANSVAEAIRKAKHEDVLHEDWRTDEIVSTKKLWEQVKVVREKDT